MPAKDFKFISPGVFINEIDNSQLPSEGGDIGPVIIGRAEQGPGLVPTRVESFQEFVEVFGTPHPGGSSPDPSRDGRIAGPTYGAYAAQAWLRNSTPVTFVRLVGQERADADDGGEAGWETDQTSPNPGATAGGAFGLFVFDSGSVATNNGSSSDVEGVLAAVWYVNSGSVALSGTTNTGDALNSGSFSSGAEQRAGTNIFVQATGDTEFKVIILKAGAKEVETKFNFNQSSEDFVRKVFNTDPTLTNTQITKATDKAFRGYWLGETFEDEVNEVLDSGVAGQQYGVILPLAQGDISGADFRFDYKEAKTGYYISQDMTAQSSSFDAANMEKLFRFVGRNVGRWASKNLKISIADLRASTDPSNDYGTFSVLVRAMNDTDNRPKILEQFNNCNLNPQSENFVGRKIGNKYLEWDDTERRYIEYGDFENNSDYLYVDLEDSLLEGKLNPQFLPFGVFGPPRFTEANTNTVIGSLETLVTGGVDFSGEYSKGGAGTGFLAGVKTLVSGSSIDTGMTQGYAVPLKFPKLRLRVSASEGNPTDLRNVFYGVDTTFNRQGRPSKTIGEYTLPKPFGIDNYVAAAGDPGTEDSFVFTLDDLCIAQDNASTATTLTGTLVYKSGSRQSDGDARGGLQYVRETQVSSGSYKTVLNLGADKFTTVMHGGYDGLDITEAEPFRNSQWSSTTTERSNYAFNTLKVAIDSLRDPENVEFDIAAQPGITNNTLNRNLVDMCEDRGDALAIIDLQGGYVPVTENTALATSRRGSVQATIDNKDQSLQINSSFGAAYYPWVQIQDTINGGILWAPPSVAAIGAMSYGQATQELWFAPAGFTRGGLSANSAAGIPVVGVRERVVSRDRDKLYEANINPIAQFPAEGIVIFGQKTLQVTPSALDRINVRRLLIFLKKQISRTAATLLFDQNVQVTWNRFRGQVEPFLASVQSRLGLADYKLILDTTTTTPDLIDRNVLYAQIFLKPARAIEFIAIDFVITDSGASFED